MKVSDTFGFLSKIIINCDNKAVDVNFELGRIVSNVWQIKPMNTGSMHRGKVGPHKKKERLFVFIFLFLLLIK